MADNLMIVQMSEAGEGVELFFRNRDKLELQNKHGLKWMQYVIEQVEGFDMSVIEHCLSVGGKKNGKPHKIQLDDLDTITTALTAQRIMDAICLSVHGKNYVDHVVFIMDEMKKRELDGSSGPPPNPEGFSANSGELLSGQE